MVGLTLELSSRGRGGRLWRRGGGAGTAVLTAGFNQQQAVGNEITVPLLSDGCHVKRCSAERHAEDDRHPPPVNPLPGHQR